MLETDLRNYLNRKMNKEQLRTQGLIGNKNIFCKWVMKSLLNKQEKLMTIMKKY